MPREIEDGFPAKIVDAGHLTRHPKEYGGHVDSPFQSLDTILQGSVARMRRILNRNGRPARRLEKIEADIQQVEKEIMAMLPDVAG